MTKKTDVWIRGGGIAGLTAAWHLHRAGYEVIVTDTSAIGSGASGAWWALMNPATGIKGTPSDGFELGMRSFEDMRIELNVQDVPWIRKEIIRPAIDPTLEKAFRISASLPEWPSGWVSWKEDVHGLSGNGALIVHEAYAIDTRLWMTTISSALRSEGVEIREQVPDHHIVTSRFVVDATGADILSDSKWSHLKLHPIKGQLRDIHVRGIGLHFNALSARGYAVQVDTNHWIIGSTYEHEFSDTGPDPAFDAYLIDRFQAMFPQPLDVKIVGRWAGVRVGSANRKPLLVEHSEFSGRFALTALGSKGLLYSQVLSHKLVQVLNTRTV